MWTDRFSSARWPCWINEDPPGSRAPGLETSRSLDGQCISADCCIEGWLATKDRHSASLKILRRAPITSILRRSGHRWRLDFTDPPLMRRVFVRNRPVLEAGNSARSGRRQSQSAHSPRTHWTAPSPPPGVSALLRHMQPSLMSVWRAPFKASGLNDLEFN